MDVKLEYKKLIREYGQQGWWPIFIVSKKVLFYGIPYKNLKKYCSVFRDSYFEIAVGAILTQNTAWKNVAIAIENLYKAKALTPKLLLKLNLRKLKSCIRPAGYFRQKAKKLRIFAKWLSENKNGGINKLKSRKIKNAREELLSLWGIGKETADSILLYALNKPIFVVDEYTRRFCAAHKIVFKEYDEYRNFFESRLPKNSKLFQEYHALLVAWGKAAYTKKK